MLNISKKKKKVYRIVIKNVCIEVTLNDYFYVQIFVEWPRILLSYDWLLLFMPKVFANTDLSNVFKFC